ncbi:MAG: methionine--tRNA ligase [Spirochaetia bacterium]
MKKRLITSALPYVNNIPHLGNLIQVLSADVFARFCRLRGYDTLYICGTDEYGTATETRAKEEGITPKELCDRYFKIHRDIYQWFNIAFDRFGRTSTEHQTEIVQHIFLKLYENGLINEKTIQQLYCESCGMFLADRYVRGTCPACSYPEARGDQCEDCGKLLDPTDLIEPRCGTCGNPPVIRETDHLYIDLPQVLPKLQEWMKNAAEAGFWANNAVKMTQSWIRDGLKERCITRDLEWGIPVPLEKYKEKVFYVWFDAPIGYISITANHTDRWEDWWRNPEEVELFQFIGKDNIPFHTVIFPSSLLGTGEKWTLLHHMSSSEYLNYEDGKFSKSKGIGVFGNDVMDTGIGPDVWRFYIFYNRPETSDAMFTWKDFQEKVNSELIGNLGNLVNRTLTFIHRYYGGKVPELDSGKNTFEELKDQAAVIRNEITELLEHSQLRGAFRKIFALSSLANKAFQDGEPWRVRKSDPAEAGNLLRTLTYLIRDLAVLIQPYIPGTSEKIASFLGNPEISWSVMGREEGIGTLEKTSIIFEQLEDDTIAELRERFSGSQAERKNRMKPEEIFSRTVDIRAAKIISVEQHPKADKLYIERIDLGTEARTIISGLVPYYKPEELEGRTVAVVSNLKPAKLRGEMSEGMLLAAEGPDEDRLEVLFLDNASPGDPVRLADAEAPESFEQIDIDTFFSVPITVKSGRVTVGETPLVCAGKIIETNDISDGKVG